MRITDIIKWTPPRAPMEQVRSITEVHNDELIIVTTMAIYKVVDDAQTEFRVIALERI